MRVKTPKPKKISSPKDIAEIFMAILKTESEADRDKEHFWILGLTTRNSIKYIELVSLGTLDMTLVHPREVFRVAIMQASSQIMMAHSHPSGFAEPSEEDFKITDELAKAGDILRIKVLDHIIITANGDYYSFKNKGHI